MVFLHELMTGELGGRLKTKFLISIFPRKHKLKRKCSLHNIIWICPNSLFSIKGLYKETAKTKYPYTNEKNMLSFLAKVEEMNVR